LETLLAALLRLYHSGDLSLLRIAELTSTAPARRFGLDAGTLRPGAPADVTLLDLHEPWIVNEHDILSRCRNTCFEDARFQGKVVKTWRNGIVVFSV
jgi:dihydroorotase